MTKIYSFSTKLQTVFMDCLTNSDSITENTPNSDKEFHQQRIKVLRKIIEEKNVHSLRKFGGPSMVAESFNSDLRNGFKTCNVQSVSLKQVDVDPPKFILFLLEELKNATLIPLFICAVICFASKLVVENSDYGWLEGVDILFNILLLVFLPSVLKYCSARNNAKKHKSRKSTVLRDGKIQDVAISEVLEGDLVCLKGGDVVPGDGIFVTGKMLEVDNILDSHIDRNDNPFIFSGSRVIAGEGLMIIVSIGANTSLGQMMLSMNRNPCEEEALFQAQMDELSKIKDYIVMLTYIFVALVVCFMVPYTRKVGQGSVQSPDLKTKAYVEFVEAMFKKILSKPRGKIIVFIYSLTPVVLGLLDILPPTILASLFWWKRNLIKRHQIHTKNIYVSGTMGLATILLFDVSKGLLLNLGREAATTLKNSGVSIILVSSDEEEMVRIIADDLDVGATFSRDSVVVSGEDFEQDEITQNNLTSIRIMYKSQPKHTLLLVKMLREKGHVVAYLGGLTPLDSPAMKESDVGIAAETYSCALACESSDAVVQVQGILQLRKCGTNVYNNIGSFIETLHTTSICILLMALVLRPLHLVWISFVLHIISFPMILMELPKEKTISLKVRTIFPNILRKVFCQTLLYLSFEFIAKILNKDVEKVMTLNILAMFQVFYLFQTMELANLQVLKKVVLNCLFIAAVGGTMICHVTLINCGAQSLSLVQWALCFLLVLLLWVLDLVTKCILHRLGNQSVRIS